MSSAMVGVIIPAYNAESFLAETLETVLAQTCQNWQAVVIDDGSGDRTAAVAEEFCQKDPRFALLRIEHRGVSAARNLGMAALPSVTHFAFLDSDDLWHPEKLERQLRQAEQGQYPLVFCAYQRFGHNPPKDPDWSCYQGSHSGNQLRRHLLSSSFLSPCCALVDAKVVQSLGGFDKSLQSAEDWDFFLRIAGAGYAALGTPETLVFYRQRIGSLSRLQPGQSFLDTAKVLGRHLPAEMRRDPEILGHLKLRFRNDFTAEGRSGRFDRLDAMLTAYLALHPDDGASNAMRWLCGRSPLPLFWAVCRYVVIPLVWHIERWRARS